MLMQGRPIDWAIQIAITNLRVKKMKIKQKLTNWATQSHDYRPITMDGTEDFFTKQQIQAK